jgi:type I restriction enzyme M protein
MMRISMMNLVLHGIRNAHVKRANTLSELGGMSDDDLRRRYKCVLMNPPFAGMLPTESIRKDLPTQSKKSELLFLGLAMESLAPGGCCAIIVPEGLLFGSTNSHGELREKLLRDFELLAVVSLPAGVFKPYAGVKTGILIFRRPPAGQAAERDGKRKEWYGRKVWFYQIDNDGYDPDKIMGGGRPETPERNDIPEMLRQWGVYKQPRFKRPPGVEARTRLAPGSSDPKCWWAPVSLLAENGYSLAPSSYKPHVSARPPEGDPSDLVREATKVEREIVSGLEKLLTDLEGLK